MRARIRVRPLVITAPARSPYPSPSTLETAIHDEGISGSAAWTVPVTAVSPAVSGSARSRVSSQNRAKSGSRRSLTSVPLLVSTVLIPPYGKRRDGLSRRVWPLCVPPVIPAADGFLERHRQFPPQYPLEFTSAGRNTSTAATPLDH